MNGAHGCEILPGQAHCSAPPLRPGSLLGLVATAGASSRCRDGNDWHVQRGCRRDIWPPRLSPVTQRTNSAVRRFAYEWGRWPLACGAVRCGAVRCRWHDALTRPGHVFPAWLIVAWRCVAARLCNSGAALAGSGCWTCLPHRRLFVPMSDRLPLNPSAASQASAQLL